MAAYAALASLAQTTNLDTNHSISHFSIAAKENIQSIHEYAITLLTSLEECPERSNRLEAELRDAAHRIEYIIEEFTWMQLYYCYGGGEIPSSLSFEEELRNATEKFVLIAGDVMVMDEQPSYSSSSSSLSSSSASASASASKVAPTANGVAIGLDEDVMAIKDRLCGLSSKLEVVPVLGMGGIGKTTLARTVYDDSVIMHRFDIRVWLTISQDYNAQKVLLDLAASMNLIEEQMSRIEMNDVSILSVKVYKHLKGRRYLVVMDDVWSTKVWDDVRNVFPDDGNGSRIMLTTRLADVAVYPDLSSPPHEMRFMNDSQSWDLLKGKVFEDGNCPPELEDVGKKIAKSCGGLPLSAVLVAGFLSVDNKNPSYWDKTSKNINSVVGQESKWILSLSYTHLPHHLRPCFLFMAMFPEDENIRASRLIRFWLAEGFLKHQNGCKKKSLEEKAEEYLEDLVKRNLVIVTSRKSDGKIKCCSLHDMVRELCIEKAHDEKFLCIIHGRVAPESIKNERRIRLSFSGLDYIHCPTIHTMLCFELQTFPCPPSVLRRFKSLRILENMGKTTYDLSSQVFELFHLRYLTLICSDNVPSAICNLVNLQTLIILPTPDMIPKFMRFHNLVSISSLPLEIWKMPQLRHLIFHSPCILPHPPEGSNHPLENIQTLAYIKDLVWTEKMLQMIPNVKRLGLVYQMDQRCNLHLLKHLHQLQKLKLCGLGGFRWKGDNLFTLPEALIKLTLDGGDFLWQDMSNIGSLPHLQVLKLKHQFSGRTWETADGEFPQLRYLLIQGSVLQHWITESSHFPRLQCLVLRSCGNLREIPQDIGEIQTLELIHVDCWNESLVKSAWQIYKHQKSYGNYDLHVRALSEEQFEIRRRQQ